jgi:hypothetical protein
MSGIPAGTERQTRDDEPVLAMKQRLSMTARYAATVVAIAALFTLAEAEPARHLSPAAALAFWIMSVGVGLALAVASVAGLTRWSGTRDLPRWQLIGLGGVIGLLLYTPLSLGLESTFPPPGLNETERDVLDELESAGGLAALVAELLQAGPLYLLTWALLNLAPTAAVTRPAILTAASAAPLLPPAIDPPGPAATTPTEPVTACPSPAPARCAADALGWPAAIGEDVLWVSADLHYLHVGTTLGRATVLGSLVAVEAHFGRRGLRIHRSHWVARRAIRRVARGASGWRCELQDGQRLPISRRRVPEVRALLGSDFVLAAQPGSSAS